MVRTRLSDYTIMPTNDLLHQQAQKDAKQDDGISTIYVSRIQLRLNSRRRPYKLEWLPSVVIEERKNPRPKG